MAYCYLFSVVYSIDAQNVGCLSWETKQKIKRKTKRK